MIEEDGKDIQIIASVLLICLETYANLIQIRNLAQLNLLQKLLPFSFVVFGKVQHTKYLLQARESGNQSLIVFVDIRIPLSWLCL